MKLEPDFQGRSRVLEDVSMWSDRIPRAPAPLPLAWLTDWEAGEGKLMANIPDLLI